MKIEIRAFQKEDTAEVIRLWTACGLIVPWNDPYKDIQRKLAVQPELFLVGFLERYIITSVMAGYDGHRGWIYYLAVHPDHQHSGFGREIMMEAEKLLLNMGCSKINLQVRSSNKSVIEFYQSIGYTRDEVISLGKRLVKDD
ncbi:MAG: GNAT family acetyltransferase [Candidatus Stygibacter australis]|nr:GNAT family acetyltransferase [Candidatus Stygibacter australis]MDP8322158.1 GNAT family acetyltransferase [Candidatus Stygibacter australis]